jgi:DNA-binding transcriptional LysR family regulator
MLDLRRLHVFREFAARGSIVRTAEALGYTPSAVSQQLAALEREAGAQLLDRTPRSARLTDAGRRLAEHADRILSVVEEAEADMTVFGAEPSGRVVVSAFPSAAVAFAPALARSLRAHNRLSLLLRQTSPEEGLRLVRSGDVEVAIADDWTGRLAEGFEVLSCFHLVRDPLVLVLPRGHHAARPDVPVDLRALRDESWLAAPAGEPSRVAVDRLLGAVGVAPPVPSEFEGLGTVVNLVGRGLGIAIMPKLSVVGSERRIVVRELPAGLDLARDVYAVARTASLRRASVAVIVATLRGASRGLTATPASREPGNLSVRGDTPGSVA